MSQLFISDMIQKSMAQGREEGIMQGIIQGREEGIEQGMERGMEKGIHQTAKNLRDTGISMDIISRSTGLTAEEIQRL